jgi:hypothetical protein
MLIHMVALTLMGLITYEKDGMWRNHPALLRRRAG